MLLAAKRQTTYILAPRGRRSVPRAIEEPHSSRPHFWLSWWIHNVRNKFQSYKKAHGHCFECRMILLFLSTELKFLSRNVTFFNFISIKDFCKRKFEIWNLQYSSNLFELLKLQMNLKHRKLYFKRLQISQSIACHNKFLCQHSREVIHEQSTGTVKVLLRGKDSLARQRVRLHYNMHIIKWISTRKHLRSNLSI